MLPKHEDEYGMPLVPRCSWCKYFIEPRNSHERQLASELSSNPPINCRNIYACCEQWEIATGVQAILRKDNNRKDNLISAEKANKHIDIAEKFNAIQEYLEEEITHWKAINKQQFGSVDLNTSLTISGTISGLEIAECFIKANTHTDENWAILISKINTEIIKIQEVQNREINIEGRNYLGGQIQGLQKTKSKLLINPIENSQNIKL